jgi:transketolase
MEACRDLNVSVVYFHTIKPMDVELVSAFRDDRILVVHDAHGLKEAIDAVGGMRTWYHGLPDDFCVWYGKVHDIRRRIGLDAAGIRARVQDMLVKNA